MFFFEKKLLKKTNLLKKKNKPIKKAIERKKLFEKNIRPVETKNIFVLRPIEKKPVKKKTRINKCT